MTTTATPAAKYRLKDGMEIPLRELTLHPADDQARLKLRTLEEFFDAAEMFRKSAVGLPTPDKRKEAIAIAAQMRDERDKACREFLLEYLNGALGKEVIEQKVFPQCNDTDMELILRGVREGNIDSTRALYEKLRLQFEPPATIDSNPKPTT